MTNLDLLHACKPMVPKGFQHSHGYSPHVNATEARIRKRSSFCMHYTELRASFTSWYYSGPMLQILAILKDDGRATCNSNENRREVVFYNQYEAYAS